METFVPTRSLNPLPGATILSLDANTSLELIELIEQGLTPLSAEQLAKHLNLSLASLLELLDISSSTYFAAKKEGRRLSPEVSSRIYRLSKVTEAAEDYFEDAQAARRWLSHPKATLEGRVPLRFARTAEGADYIVKLLGRMAYGVIS